MKKIILSISTIIILVIAFLIFILINVKKEFEEYLKVNYPNNIFQVDLPKIDFIYGSYYSDVFCISDSISFKVSKSWNTKEISDHYIDIKDNEKNNFEIAEIFSNSEVEKYISSISAGNKFPTIEKYKYDSINIIIIRNNDMLSIISDILKTLKENKVKVDEIGITYEKDMSVYEGHFTDKDYDLSINEIEEKIIKIK